VAVPFTLSAIGRRYKSIMRRARERECTAFTDEPLVSKRFLRSIALTSRPLGQADRHRRLDNLSPAKSGRRIARRPVADGTAPAAGMGAFSVAENDRCKIRREIGAALCFPHAGGLR